MFLEDTGAGRVGPKYAKISEMFYGEVVAPSPGGLRPAQPTFNECACRSPTSMVSHISVVPNVVISWFLGPELSLADRVFTSQLQSSGTRFLHGCALPPLVMDNSEMNLKPTSYYKPTHDPLRTLVSRVYLLTTAKPLMFACPLFRKFREPNKTAKLKGMNINCRPKIGRNYYSISNYTVLVRQNKSGQNNFACKFANF